MPSTAKTDTPDTDALAAMKKASKGRGPVNDGLCKAARVIANMDATQGATVNAALNDPDISSAAILKWMGTLEGVAHIASSTLNDHRAGRCLCTHEQG